MEDTVITYMKYHPGIYLEELRNTMKNLGTL
jgi:hypothetical protein